MAKTRTLQVRRLGLVEYEDGLTIMRAMVKARGAGLIPDTLLLLEHNPVLTLGRGSRDGKSVLWPIEDLNARGVEVHETDRGGDVTYHGPGQIVGYPIFDLSGDRQDVPKYVRNIEEVMIRTVADYGLRSQRAEKLPGVWMGRNKVAAVGVHIERWITSHGFALNANTDLSYFNMIIACGIPGRSVTSLARQLEADVDLEEVMDRIVENACAVFDAEPTVLGVQKETVSVYLWRRTQNSRELLLFKRTRERGDFWQPVTGQVEPGELPGPAAIRELAEETGLAAQPQPIPYVHAFIWPPVSDTAPRYLREFAYQVEVPAEFQPTLDPEEHVDWKWARFDDAIEEVPHRGLKRGIQHLLKTLER